MKNVVLAVITIVTMVFTSCKKDSTEPTQLSVSQMLTAKTWQVEEVTDHMGGNIDKLYKRGANNNQDDYSLVRQQFKTDGTITYTDEFGITGKDGLWELQDNNKKIKLNLPSMGLSVVCEDVTVTANSFSYKLTYPGNGYVLFTFSPLP